MGEGGNLRFGLGPIRRELQPEISRRLGARRASPSVCHGRRQEQSHADEEPQVRIVLTPAGDIVITSAVAKKPGQEVPWTRGG